MGEREAPAEDELVEGGDTRLRRVEAELAEARAEIHRLRREQADLRIHVDKSRAEAALRESEERFRALAESMPVLVFVLEADGVASFFNQRWREYTGIDAGTRALRLALVHPEDRPEMELRWSEARIASAQLELDFRMMRHDGEYRWFLLRAQPMVDERGEVLRWVGTATDIHERRLVADALEASEALARSAAEALEAEARRKDELLAMLSHELRNPLAPARTALDILARAAPGSEQARRAEAVVGRQVEHLSRIVDDLLDVRRLAHGGIELRRAPMGLAELIDRVAEDHRPLFAAVGVDLEVTVMERPVPVDADGARLGQVLAKLLQNAAKFTPRGGRVALALCIDRARRLVEVSVRDTGVGIEPRVLPHVFDVFTQADETLDRSRGGLGLGLPLVRGVVELHGGTIEARSAGRGQGTEMLIRLPLGGAVSSSAVVLSEPPVPSSARRVLIVEDNVDAADSLKCALELEGHVVEVAYAGAEGLELARRFLPDVVLSDIGLPGMDGYGLARAIRADPALAPTFLVALTGYAQPGDVAAAGAAGFDRHLAKPAPMERLAVILAEAPRLPGPKAA